MTRRTLQDWYNSNDISYNEKERLNKIGVSNHCDYHYLEDLKQILRCENWAKNSSEIRNKLDSRIKKIIFFTPNFNDSKPDASNYSCAIVTNGSDDNWVIVYRPSHVSGIGNDVIMVKTDVSASVMERALNGSYPIAAIETWPIDITFDSLYIRRINLPYDAKYNPDKYLLPLDVVRRGIHFAVYLGNEWVAHLTGKGESEGTKFDTWSKFSNPNGSSGSSSSFFSSSGSGSGNESMICYHPKVPFKRKGDIIRHIAKAISHKYGRCDCHSYNVAVNNCENLVQRWIFGIDNSSQTGPISWFGTAMLASRGFSHSEQIEMTSKALDNLTSSYVYEKGRIERYIQEAENNHSYTRSKYQIQQEKFGEKIEVYPKDWCRVQ